MTTFSASYDTDTPRRIEVSEFLDHETADGVTWENHYITIEEAEALARELLDAAADARRWQRDEFEVAIRHLGEDNDPAPEFWLGHLAYALGDPEGDKEPDKGQDKEPGPASEFYRTMLGDVPAAIQYWADLGEFPGGVIKVREREDRGADWGCVMPSTLEQGVEKWLELDHPSPYCEKLAHNLKIGDYAAADYDADHVDMFVQLALLGDIRYS